MWSVRAVPGVDRDEPVLYFEVAAQSVSSPTFLEGRSVEGLVGSSGPPLIFGSSDIVPSRMPVCSFLGSDSFGTVRVPYRAALYSGSGGHMLCYSSH